MAISVPGRLRIALTYPGDATDPSVRSGTPHGVLTGLKAVGADVFPVDVRPAPRVEQVLALATAWRHQRGLAGLPVTARVRRGYGASLQSPLIARARSIQASRRLAALGPLDAVVQLGGGYHSAGSAPTVVYDDMTITQALAFPYPAWQALHLSDVRARVQMQRDVYQSAASVCVESGWAAESVIGDFAVPARQVQVVGTASSIEPRRVNRDWSTPRFLFVGLDFERKNGPRVLRAFARVRTLYPTASLDVVGGHPPVDQPGVVGYGILPRNTPQGRAALRARFDAATCFVMPSLHEPAGVVFTEAAAAGIPSIGGTVGGSADLIGDGGVVVAPDDDGALVRAMLEYCDSERARSAGESAALRAPQMTWPALAHRLLDSLGLAGVGSLAEPSS